MFCFSFTSTSVYCLFIHVMFDVALFWQLNTLWSNVFVSLTASSLLPAFSSRGVKRRTWTNRRCVNTCASSSSAWRRGWEPLYIHSYCVLVSSHIWKYQFSQWNVYDKHGFLLSSFFSHLSILTNLNQILVSTLVGKFFPSQTITVDLKSHLSKLTKPETASKSWTPDFEWISGGERKFWIIEALHLLDYLLCVFFMSPVLSCVAQQTHPASERFSEVWHILVHLTFFYLLKRDRINFFQTHWLQPKKLDLKVEFHTLPKERQYVFYLLLWCVFCRK